MANMSSDLDFLNQTLDKPAQPRPSASTVPNDTELPPNPPAENGTSTALEDAGIPSDILKSLQGLSPAERAAFAPLLHALSSTAPNDPGQETGNPNISTKDVQDLLQQFDAADSVADTLEGKLDRLLESLEEVEDAFPEEQDHKGTSGIGRRKASEGGVGPQQLPETMAGEAKNAFEEVAKHRG